LIYLEQNATQLKSRSIEKFELIMMKSLGNWRFLVASTGLIGVLAFFSYLSFSKINWALLKSNLANIALIYISIAIGYNFLILLLNTVKWKLFLSKQPLPFPRIYRVIAVMAMMANIIPWGQTFAIYHLGEKEKVGKVISLSILTLEQITEGLSKTALFLFVTLICPLPLWMKQGISVAFIVVVLFCLTLYLLAKRYEFFSDNPKLNHLSLWNKFIQAFSKWAHHLHTIRDYKRFLLTIALSIMTKLCEVMAVFIIQKGMHMDLPFWSPFFVVAALNLVYMVPITPGNLGIFEATAYFAYTFMGVPPTQALSLSLVIHFVYLLPMIVPGLLISMRSGINLKPKSLSRKSSVEAFNEN